MISKLYMFNSHSLDFWYVMMQFKNSQLWVTTTVSILTVSVFNFIYIVCECIRKVHTTFLIPNWKENWRISKAVMSSSHNLLKCLQSYSSNEMAWHPSPNDTKTQQKCQEVSTPRLPLILKKGRWPLYSWNFHFIILMRKYIIPEGLPVNE